MRVNNCPKLTSILSPSNLKCMQNLEELNVKNCESVKVGFDVGVLNADEDHGAVRALPSLHSLELYGLPNLTHVWANYSPGIQGFQNLRSLIVYGCDRLRILFSPFIAKLLVKLEQLYVGNCDVMKAIIAWEQEVDDEGMRNTIIFPQLKSVEFSEMPNLTSITSQTCIFGSSFLKRLKLNNITKLIGLCPASESNFDTTVHSLFNNKDTLTSIEVMHAKLTSILSPSNLKCMQNLEKLVIDECESVKVAFDVGALNAGEDHGAARALPSLDNLELDELPNLTHVRANYSPGIQGFQNLTYLRVHICGSLRILFPPIIAKLLVKLEQLYIEKCDVMEAIIAWEQEVDDEGMRNTIIFPRLTKVNLKDLPNLMSFCPQAYTIEGKFLKCLLLHKIPKLIGLCPASESNFDTPIYSLFNNKDTLTSIEILEVSAMDNLIEICPRDLKTKLRKMRVYNCAKLSSILLPSNLIECMQNLEELIVNECDSVKVAFDLGALNAGEDHGVARALPSLDNLTLGRLPNLTHVCVNYSPGIQGFQNLRSLAVYNCDSLRILFSPFIAKLLVKLEQLDIRYCDVIEAIIAWEQEVDDEGMRNTIIFPRLTKVKLKDLPNLTSFCPQAYTIEGTFLKTVDIVNCSETMVLPSAFQLMQRL